MDKKKMSKQAKVLRDKKLARIAAVAKAIRPKVKDGVVKYDTAVAQKAGELRKVASPPTPRTVREVGPRSKPTEQQQIQTQQKINPHQVIRKKKGCSGCRRQIGQKNG